MCSFMRKTENKKFKLNKIPNQHHWKLPISHKNHFSKEPTSNTNEDFLKLKYSMMRVCNNYNLYTNSTSVFSKVFPVFESR